MVPVVGDIHPAYAVERLTSSRASYSSCTPINSSIDWSQVYESLTDVLRKTHDSTEDYAASELTDWLKDLMKNVDDKFLNWYFSYGNQKAMDFGVPFAWLVFKVDSPLKILRKENEKDLNANQILNKRMIEDFQTKFNELVLDTQQQKSFEKLIERIGRYYALAIDVKFNQIKNEYRIPDLEWDKYLNDISTVVYDTGNSRYSLSPESLSGNLTTKIIFITTAAMGSKIALNLTAKTVGTVFTKVGAQLLDPILIAGLLILDIWDYNRMVNESRPILRQNIFDYFNELKMSLLNSPENSIMTAIEEVEDNIINGLESHLTS
ncbi:hypothetical protein NDI49_30600 [Trichocoleus sp. ST-U3]